MLISRLGVQVPLGAPRIPQEPPVPPFRAALFVFTARRSLVVAIYAIRQQRLHFRFVAKQTLRAVLVLYIAYSALYDYLPAFIIKRGAEPTTRLLTHICERQAAKRGRASTRSDRNDAARKTSRRRTRAAADKKISCTLDAKRT